MLREIANDFYMNQNYNCRGNASCALPTRPMISVLMNAH